MFRRIIIDDAIPQAEAIFGHLGQLVLKPGKSITAEDLIQAHALIIRSRTQVNDSLLQHAKELDFIGSTVVGLDHVDFASLAKNHIHFYSAQGCNANSVSEYVVAQMLSYMQDQGKNLAGKTLGIVGVGHVGKRVQAKAQALGMKVLLNDPPRRDAEADFNHTPLEALLPRVDVLTLHTPLTHDGAYPTWDLISARNVDLLPPEALVINAARGGILNEDAWRQRQHLAGIFDCWTGEPHIHPETLQKAYRSSTHIAGHSMDAKLNGSWMAYEALCQRWQITPQERHSSVEVKRLSPPQTEDFEKQLHLWLQEIFDFAPDDLVLRQAPAQQISKIFEDHRRHYPLRWEWQHFQLPQDSWTQQHTQSLCALGFLAP